MSKLLYAISLLFTSLALTAQNTTVHIRFRGLQTPTAEVTLPVNEAYYFLNKKHRLPDKDSTIHISLHLTKAALIRCEGYSFIIEPGITDIVIDKNKKGLKAIQYNGPNKEGQLLYQKWNPDFYQYAGNRYLKKILRHRV